MLVSDKFKSIKNGCPIIKHFLCRSISNCPMYISISTIKVVLCGYYIFHQ